LSLYPYSHLPAQHGFTFTCQRRICVRPAQRTAFLPCQRT